MCSSCLADAFLPAARPDRATTAATHPLQRWDAAAGTAFPCCLVLSLNIQVLPLLLFLFNPRDDSE